MYACALLFMYRAGVSVALVYMTQQSKLSTLNRTTTEIIDQYFDWNQNKQVNICNKKNIQCKLIYLKKKSFTYNRVQYLVHHSIYIGVYQQ